MHAETFGAHLDREKVVFKTYFSYVMYVYFYVDVYHLCEWVPMESGRGYWIP